MRAGLAQPNGEKAAVTVAQQQATAVSYAATQQAVQAALAKDAECTGCHDATAGHLSGIYTGRHGNKADSRTPGCQTCHGASDAHKIDPTAKSPEVVFGAKSKHLSSAADRNGACLQCHGKNVLPRANWSGSTHDSHGVACSTCHNTHDTNQKVLSKATQSEVCFTCHKTQRAETHHVSSHPLTTSGSGQAPKMSCTDCHNPHGSTGPTLLIKNTVNETCYTCHAEKRGPFLWEHSPVTDSCTNCHAPHGSVNAPMLKARAPWLCQECHSGDHGAAVNSGANLAGGNATTVNGAQQAGAAAPRAQMNARACLNCHVLIHGSNHPAGSKFQR